MYRYVYILIGRFHLIPPKQHGEELKKIVKSVRDGTFEYDSKEPVKTDWAQYPKSGVSRGSWVTWAGVYVNVVPKPSSLYVMSVDMTLEWS